MNIIIVCLILKLDLSAFKYKELLVIYIGQHFHIGASLDLLYITMALIDTLFDSPFWGHKNTGHLVRINIIFI